jgi:uncharacterized surface protein with fasciclin (FAS1) repeats
MSSRFSRIGLLLASSALLVAASAPAFAANLYETLKADPQFSTLVKIIDANGVRYQYVAASPRTVFAPTDAAFAKTRSGGSDLAAPGDASTTQNAQALLLYQIVPGRLTEESLKGKVQTLTTMQTGKVSIDGTGSAIHFGDKYGGTVTGTPIAASNGLIYPIDTLPVPVFGEVDSQRPKDSEPVPDPIKGTAVPIPGNEMYPPPPTSAAPPPPPMQ